MKILAIGAHPDDVEFGCGGLIIKETKKGSRVKIAVCSLGEAGSSGTPKIRKKEAQKSAKLAGAEIQFLNMGGDSHIQYIPKNSIKIAELIRQFKPEVVLAPEMQRNQHPDHYAVAQITHSACRLARYGGLKELKNLGPHKINALYFYTSRAEISQRPDVIIDVSQIKYIWEKAISAHKSQMKTRDYKSMIFNKAAALGASVGVKYAIGLWVNDPIRIGHLSDLTLSSRKY